MKHPPSAAKHPSNAPSRKPSGSSPKSHGGRQAPRPKWPLGLLAIPVLLLAGWLLLMPHGAPPPAGQSSGGDTLLVRADSARSASDAAPVTLVEFGDYQCPSCGSYYPVVKQVVSEFQGKLNFVFRNFPLQQHRNAYLAARAAEAAGLQSQFWAMHDKLFENQGAWSESSTARDIFVQYAQSLGLNVDRFQTDLFSNAVKAKIDRDLNDGDQAGVNGTPTFYVNGAMIQNPSSVEEFRTAINVALQKAPTPAPPPTLEAAYHIHANLKVILDGKPLDLTQDKYQSTATHELDPYVHLHDGNGDVVHVHKKGETLGDFFKSLGMSLAGTCLTTDAGQKYCSAGGATLKLFVNGKPNTQFDAYVPQDLDRILLSFGSESDAALQAQIASVADTACIYSLKCPERGKPPTETCVGGLGTKCSD
jgi:protein-disulfide isomerase